MHDIGVDLGLHVRCAQERAATQGNNSSGVGCISVVATLDASEGQQPPAKRPRPTPSLTEAPPASAAPSTAAPDATAPAADSEHGGPGEGPVAASVRRRVGWDGFARIRDVLTAQSDTLHQQACLNSPSPLLALLTVVWPDVCRRRCISARQGSSCTHAAVKAFAGPALS